MSLKSTSSTRNCVDWTTKWHRKSKVEHSSIFHRFWKSNRRWVIQVESMSFFWRGYTFHNGQSIDRMLMWYFNVESMGNRRRCVCWIHFYLIFSREICVGQRWKNYWRNPSQKETVHHIHFLLKWIKVVAFFHQKSYFVFFYSILDNNYLYIPCCS